MVMSEYCGRRNKELFCSEEGDIYMVWYGI